MGRSSPRLQRDRIQGYLDSAIAEGGTFACGGGRPADRDTGFFIYPTVIAGLDNNARVAREEIFGPVLTVIAHDGDDDAVRIANDSPFGLSGTVFSPDEERAAGVAARMRVGTVNINGGVWYSADVPFGGYKQSGIGREMGIAGFEEYLETKAIATARRISSRALTACGLYGDQFTDKVAIVTGAGGGIGQAYAESLAREGAAVVVADINVEGAQKVADGIKGEGGNALGGPCRRERPRLREGDGRADALGVRRHRLPRQQRRHLRRHEARLPGLRGLGLLQEVHEREHGRRAAVHPGGATARWPSVAVARSSTSPRPRPGCTPTSTGWPRSASTA